MNREEIHNFVFTELNNNWHEGSEIPFRVAVSNDLNGSDRAYGSHTEFCEYADTTINYCYTKKQAEITLFEAAYEAERRNMEFRHQAEVDALNDECYEVLATFKPEDYLND